MRASHGVPTERRKAARDVVRLTLATSGYVAASLWIENPFGRRGKFRKLVRRTDGAGDKVAPAIGATPAKPVVGTIAAKGAFERADERVRCCWRQVLVATFTGWSQREHRRSPHVYE